MDDPDWPRRAVLQQDARSVVDVGIVCRLTESGAQTAVRPDGRVVVPVGVGVGVLVGVGVGVIVEVSVPVGDPAGRGVPVSVFPGTGSSRHLDDEWLDGPISWL